MGQRPVKLNQSKLASDGTLSPRATPPRSQQNPFSRFSEMSESSQPPQSPEHDRRDFLTARSLRDQLARQSPETSGEGHADKPELLAAASGQPEHWLQHFSHRAMACDFQVFLNLGQYPQGPAAAIDAFTLVDTLEDRFSIFRSHSELSRINQFAFATPVPVESDLYSLLELAADLHTETSGAFDISTTALTRAWNFYTRQPSVPSSDTIAAALERIGQQHVQLDQAQRSVRFLRAGLELNLHSLGKGYAVQQMALHLQQAGVHDFIIHGGQSSVLAVGDCLPSQSNFGGWRIGLTHPIFPEQRLGELTLANRALGTSGSARQGLVHRGQRLGNILDPRSGWPASHWLSTTVLHPSAAQADALATAFFVMSEAEIVAYCRAHPETAAILLRPRGTAGQLEARLLQFAPPHLELTPAFRNLPIEVLLPAAVDSSKSAADAEAAPSNETAPP